MKPTRTINGVTRQLLLLIALLAAILPASAKDGDRFFYNGLYFRVLSEDQKTAAVDYGDYTGVIVIPETAQYARISWEVPDSYTVTTIGNSSFDNCFSLTSVTIPNSVTSIGDCAFSYCTALTDATIPNSVTSIGNEAFYNCPALTEVTIPNSVTSIGNKAFYGCYKVETLNIKTSKLNVKTVFGGCPVKYLTIDTPGAIISDEAFYCFRSTLKTASITAKILGKKAFNYCCNMTDLTLDKVMSIGDKAFFDCSKLTSVTIPNSVTSIGNEAFSYCTALTDVTIPNSVTSIGNEAFSGCSALTEVTIPNSVTSIGVAAFSGCSAITSVNIGSSINEEALSNSHLLYCSNSIAKFDVSKDNPHLCLANGAVYSKDKSKLYRLAPGRKDVSFTIPNTVTAVGFDAFSGCSALTSMTIPNSVTTIGSSAFNRCSSLASIVIPDAVTTIGSWTFNECTSLKTVDIGNSLEDLTNTAFGGCSALTEINVSSSNPHLCSENGVVYSKDKSTLCCYPPGKKGSFSIPSAVTSIGNSAFGGCSALTSVTIPNSVTSIGNSAFYGCSALTEVTIPNSVTSIGDGVFSYCTALTDATIPNSVTSIGDQVFRNCSALASVNIGDGIMQIPLWLFMNCTSLKTVSIGKSVETIDAGCFYDTPLQTIYCQTNNPPTLKKSEGGYWPFNNDTYSNAMLYVPTGRGFKYVAAEGWREFRNIEEMDSGVEDVVGEEAVIRVVDGSIVIDGTAADAPVEVYDMTGEAVYRGSAAEIPSMLRGIYIVRIGGKSVKVAV